MGEGDAPAPTSIHDVTDDLLELILLRLSSSVCLVRAAAACKLWRRVIADARFLRRFRSLQGPTVAGYYFNSFCSFSNMTKPSFDPLSPSPTAIDSGHFSLDFLSDVVAGLHHAEILDSRGSLLLMAFKGVTYLYDAFPDALVVCEPLTRRHQRIPPPRDFDDDATSCDYFRSYLLDGDDADDVGRIGMSNFRVLCELHRGGVAHAAVFTAGGAEPSWSESKAVGHIIPRLDYMRHVLGHAAGSWYFHIKDMPVTVLDGRTGEYSSFALPTTTEDVWSHNFFIADGHDGKPRISLLKKDSTVKVFTRLDGGEWVLEKRIDVRETIRALLGHEYVPPSFFAIKYVFGGDRWPLSIWSTGPGFIILRQQLARTLRFFSVDLETTEVKPAGEEMWRMLYRCDLPWPPALHACCCLDR